MTALILLACAAFGVVAVLAVTLLIGSPVVDRALADFEAHTAEALAVVEEPDLDTSLLNPIEACDIALWELELTKDWS